MARIKDKACVAVLAVFAASYVSMPALATSSELKLYIDPLDCTIYTVEQGNGANRYMSPKECNNVADAVTDSVTDSGQATNNVIYGSPSLEPATPDIFSKQAPSSDKDSFANTGDALLNTLAEKVAVEPGAIKETAVVATMAAVSVMLMFGLAVLLAL
jgi:hypothetical protein